MPSSTPLPAELLVLVFVLGAATAFFRPYRAFLGSLVLSLALAMPQQVQTRTELFGPYLNLSDVLLVNMLVAVLIDSFWRRRRLRLPSPVILMSIALILGHLVCAVEVGWTYETVRALKWAGSLPLAIFLSANVVVSERRAEGLAKAMLLGAILASAFHIAEALLGGRGEGVDLVRIIAYSAGYLPCAFFLRGVLGDGPLPGPVKSRLGAVLTLLMGLSILLEQTRSVLISVVVTGLFILGTARWLHFVEIRLGRFGRSILVLGMLILMTLTLLPQTSLLRLTRLDTLTASNPDDRLTDMRWRALEIETNDWLAGNILIGRGLGYSQIHEGTRLGDKSIAFGHLGYITYLSQLGLLGLLIYGLLVPLVILRRGLLLSRASRHYTKVIGSLAAISIVQLSLMFLMSSSFLATVYLSTGCLYGAVFGLQTNGSVAPRLQPAKMRRNGIAALGGNRFLLK